MNYYLNQSMMDIIRKTPDPAVSLGEVLGCGPYASTIIRLLRACAYRQANEKTGVPDDPRDPQRKKKKGS